MNKVKLSIFACLLAGMAGQGLYAMKEPVLEANEAGLTIFLDELRKAVKGGDRDQVAYMIKERSFPFRDTYYDTRILRAFELLTGSYDMVGPDLTRQDVQVFIDAGKTEEIMYMMLRDYDEQSQGEFLFRLTSEDRDGELRKIVEEMKADLGRVDLDSDDEEGCDSDEEEEEEIPSFSKRKRVAVASVAALGVASLVIALLRRRG